MPPPYELQALDNGTIVVLRFQNPETMNQLLDPISDRVDGPIKNRMVGLLRSGLLFPG